MKNSNYFWRIVFTILIVIEHSGIYNVGWYISVEYFFILSGFLLATAVDQDLKYVSTGSYIKHRMVRFFPHLFFSFVILFVWKMNMGGVTIYRAINLFFEHMFEMIPGTYFLCGIDSSGSYPYNFPVWYISVLIIVSIVMFYLARTHKSLFYDVIAPISVILIYVYLWRNRTNFNTGQYIGILDDYLIRGWADMALGCVVYTLVEITTRWSKTKLYYWTCHIIEYICFISVIILSAVRGNSKYDCYYALILGLGIWCSFQYQGMCEVKSMKRISSLTYAIYLNHIFVINVIYTLFPEHNKKILVPIFAILFLYSFLTDKIVTFLTQKVICIWNKKFISLCQNNN